VAQIVDEYLSRPGGLPDVRGEPIRGFLGYGFGKGARKSTGYGT
jgi:hypothetical protein